MRNEFFICCRFLCGIALGVTAAALPLPAETLRELQGDFEGFASRYCYECHGPDNAEAEMDLKEILESPGGFFAHQEALLLSYDAIDFGDMPPRKALQPSEEERTRAVDSLVAMTEWIESQTRGDPGKIVMPRLTPSEYDRVLRDLAGREVKAGFLLPNDGGAGEGFSNVGEAQPISLRHIEQFLNAARFAQDSLIATPAGLYWHHQRVEEIGKPEHMLDALDKALKQELQKIHDRLIKEVLFVRQTDHQGNDKADLKAMNSLYLQAAWRYRYRSELGMPGADFEEVAHSVDPRMRGDVLKEWVTHLAHPDEEWAHAVHQLIEQWKALPEPDRISEEDVAATCDEVLDRWHHLPLLFWFLNRDWNYELNRDGGAERRAHQQLINEENRWPFNIDIERFAKPWEQGRKMETETPVLHLATTTAGDSAAGDVMLWHGGRFIMEDGSEQPWDAFIDGEVPPVGTIEAVQAEGKLAVRVQAPAVFKVKIPDGATRFEVEATPAEGYQDKATVQVLVLRDTPEKDDLVFYRKRRTVTYPGKEPGSTYMRTMGASHKPLRETNNKSARHPAMLSEKALGILHKANARKPDEERRYPYYFSTEDIYQEATPEERRYLEQVTRIYNQTVIAMDEGLEPERLRSIAHDQLAALMKRAWKRPIRQAELEEIATLFDRTYAEQSVYDTAFKQALTAILVSPNFIYRLPAPTELAQQTAENGIRPLTGHELASRLSFALWASLPDDDLLRLAESGELRDAAVLEAQVGRMMADPRADAMAVEFAGQWFQFSTFASHSEPDPELFPEFDSDLARAMYDEVRLFFSEIFLEDRSILNVLDADFTYVNEELATKIYNIEGVEGDHMRRVNIDDPRRGGILTMGATLTKTSLALRTSAVKRGVYVLEELLGAHLPDPPPVPALSQSETNEQGLNVVEQLKVHRENPSCAACHAKFDPLGIALENFDPIGRWRTEDAGGNPVITTDALPDGTVLDGPEALRAILQAEQDRFLHHFARKLTGYLLGRAVTVGDNPLLEDIKESLRENEYRPGAAVRTVVLSRQFTHSRLPEALEGDVNEAERPASFSSNLQPRQP